MSVGSLNPILFIGVQQHLATGTCVFRVGSYGLYLDLVPSDQPTRIPFRVFVIPNEPTFETVNLFCWPGRKRGCHERHGTLNTPSVCPLCSGNLYIKNFGKRLSLPELSSLGQQFQFRLVSRCQPLWPSRIFVGGTNSA